MANFKLMSIQINSTEEPVKTYIGIRYDRWADYSRYKCDKAGMKGKECEVLSEVLYSLLKRDENFLIKLYNRKKVQKGKNLTELDFFVLRAIDLNVNSPTSPYRHKNRLIPANSNVRLERLKLADQLPVDEVDKSEILLKEYRLVRWIFSGLDLTEFERAVFEYRFIHDEPFAKWPGPEKPKKLYCIYTQIVRVIQTILFENKLSMVKPKTKLTKRESEILTQFLDKHKIHKQPKEFNI